MNIALYNKNLIKGMIYLLPHGNRIFLALQDLLRKEYLLFKFRYKKRNYLEVYKLFFNI
jgi:hypothetical protein